MKRRNFLGGISAILGASVIGIEIPSALPVEFPIPPRNIPHMAGVYYIRVAFDQHSQGKTRDEASTIARIKTLGFDGVRNIDIFPEIPWDRYEQFHGRA